MFLRTVAVLACAAYAAAIHCAQCAGTIDLFNLNSNSVCYTIDGSNQIVTQCTYAQPNSPASNLCEYNEAGKSIGNWALCPGTAGISNADNCLACSG